MGNWPTLLAALHRYLGIGLCLFFAMWFASGTVMLFHPFPALTEARRFECLEPIDLGTTTVHPSLLERASTDETEALRLTSLIGRAVVHRHGAQSIDSYWADTGDGPIRVSTAQARRVAGRCGQGEVGSVQTIMDDQWTVHQSFDAHRPLQRVRVDDSSATVLYVSSRTGEVVQRTTRAERAWNWIGSVPHWIYPTVIRRHWELWDALVWWLAGIGSVGACTGLILGLVRWRRSVLSNVSPFQGALYWHHVSGLGIGFVVLAWILSGGLSMDHGRLFSTGVPTREQQRALAGTARFDGDPQAVFSARRPNEPIKEVEWLRVASRPYVAARTGPGMQQIASVDHTALPAAATFSSELFSDVESILVPEASLVEHRVLETFDTYYYGRAHTPRPLPVLRLRYDDPASTWLHVDLTTGKLLERLDAGRRAYRFWFNAVHSHDLPWMLERPALRRSWMTFLCAAGFLFSCNGAWLAWKRLRPRRV